MRLILGIKILTYIFETYLLLRQRAAFRVPTLPEPLQGVVTQEKYEESRAYGLDAINFVFVQKAVVKLIDISMLYFGFFPWFWKRSGDFLMYVGLNAENEVIHSLAYSAGFLFCSQIVDLPLLLYGTFVIDGRHGFNNQTGMLFFKDMLKGIGNIILLGPPSLFAVIFVVQIGGPYLAIYLWAFWLVTTNVMMTLYPILIVPRFNKLTPLPDGELRTEIEKLASSHKFPLKKIFVIDGSSPRNAYMCGFFKSKSIMLYDTFIQKCQNTDEVVSIIAHELGHWKFNHTLYSTIATQVFYFLQFGGYTLARNSKDLFQSFGFETQPVLMELIIFQHIVKPLGRLVRFGLNLVSRSFEFQADAFTTKLGYYLAFRAVLIKPLENDPSPINTDAWYSAYHYSRPQLVERLAALGESNKKED
ncbi:Peptidase M48 [Macleaya cordata]|uniref:CAAX prenyl protease n=1 Tax=Macleaya cordata TaxID=56857 RepID=A0A200QU33_MACCD|nr:Peptidase M48 [Macleaya cordata]